MSSGMRCAETTLASMPDAELLENMHCVLHRVPVGTGAHHHADLDVFHSVGDAQAAAPLSALRPAPRS